MEAPCGLSAAYAGTHVKSLTAKDTKENKIEKYFAAIPAVMINVPSGVGRVVSPLKPMSPAGQTRRTRAKMGSLRPFNSSWRCSISPGFTPPDA